MSNKLDSVNVIQMSNRDSVEINNMWSFKETTDGNKLAEAKFIELVKTAAEINKMEITETDIDIALDNGVFNIGNDIGDGAIILIHSTE